MIFTFFRKFVNKHFVFILIVFTLFSYFGIDLVVFISPKLGALKLARDSRLEKFFGSSSFFANTMNFALAWVSTIPAFSVKAEFRNLLAASYSIIKFYFSFIFIFCIYKVVRKRLFDLYPLFMILFFNIILTIVSCTSLEYRFMLPVVYIYYIFIAFFYDNSDELLYIMRKKISFGMLHLLISPLAILMVLYYNLR